MRLVLPRTAGSGSVSAGAATLIGPQIAVEPAGWMLGLLGGSAAVISALLGQSVLKTHVIDGERIYPYGFFAEFETPDGMPLPIEEPILLIPRH